MGAKFGPRVDANAFSGEVETADEFHCSFAERSDVPSGNSRFPQPFLRVWPEMMIVFSMAWPSSSKTPSSRAQRSGDPGSIPERRSERFRHGSRVSLRSPGMTALYSTIAKI